MSTLSHPRGAAGREKEASRPAGLTLGPALIERTANAVEAVVRRHEAAADLYLSLVREVFAITDEPSNETCPSIDGSSVVAPTSSSLTRGPVVGGDEVRANAPGDAISVQVGGGLPLDLEVGK